MLGNSDTILFLKGVEKSFRKRRVVAGINLLVRKGEVYALVGPNGAGKTTTLRIVTGIYRPDKGIVKICGLEPQKARESRCIAYLPENISVYERLTGYEHLRLVIGLYVEQPEEREKLLHLAAKYSGLEPRDLERKTGEYSKGMRRRLLIAALLAISPPLLVLDEPTSGLDVFSSVTVRNLVKRVADEGRAVLVTSHNMLEVERIASRVGFIHNGTIVAEGRPDQLLSEYDAADLEEAFVKAVGRLSRK